MEITSELKENLLLEQQDEITAHHLYKRIAKVTKDTRNRQILERISEDELKHYKRLEMLTGASLKPQRLKVFVFFWLARIFGITFGIKLLERSESQAIDTYKETSDALPEITEIMLDEERHETELIDMIDEEHLNYMGSVVLGLNDALVELTGALAGYTFAFQNTRLIALTGLITGISASFSMAASEYLSSRQEGGDDALKSSMYTGAAYVFTVIALVLPFLILKNPFISLVVTLAIAVLIIFVFNYYISVAKDYDFKKRFVEMASISMGVAGISFLIGVLIKKYIGVDI